MQAWVQFTKDGRPQKIVFGKVLTVGRSQGNDVSLDGKKVSRSHAILRCLTRNEYYIIDLGSLNGTLLNNQRVVTPTRVKNGDQIDIGSTVLTFCQEEDYRISPEADEEQSSVTIPETLSPAITETTILVADIRGYTRLSEALPLHVLAHVLSDWFRQGNDIIERHRGTVDKFIGDAVMARWNPCQESLERIIMSSLRAAHELHSMTQLLSTRFSQLPHPLRIGVGINTGQAILSATATGRDYDDTVLGDSVNMAFRLESASKDLECDVVVSRSVFEHLSRHLWKTGCEKMINVKGKDEPICVLPLTFEDLASFLKTEDG